MAKKIEMYEGKPVLVAADHKKLEEAIASYEGELEAPYVVRVKGKKIKKMAFSGVTTIGTVIIDEKVEEIESCAFSGCSALTCVIISGSVKKIGYDVWEKCTGIESFVIEPDNSTYDSRDNCNALIETSTNTLLLACKNTVIPNSVTCIGCYAFRNCPELSTITIPNSVTKLDGHAFEGTSLTSIELPDSLEKISCGVFYGLKNLTSIKIPSSVTDIACEAFRGCHGLTSLDLPKSLQEMDFGVFCDCRNLTSINIPNGNKLIRPYMFKDCTSLTSITIPESVTMIHIEAFCGCSALTSIAIPDSVTEIGEGAFMGCTGLTDITIPDSVTEIGYDAFCDCSGLKEITIKDARLLESASVPEGVNIKVTGANLVRLKKDLSDRERCAMAALSSELDNVWEFFEEASSANGLTDIVFSYNSEDDFDFCNDSTSKVMHFFGYEVWGFDDMNDEGVVINTTMPYDMWKVIEETVSSKEFEEAANYDDYEDDLAVYNGVKLFE